MAFTDPQSVTINSVAKSMPRVKIDGQLSVYQNSDESWKMTLSHQASGTRTRSMARLDQRKVVTDPLTAANDYDFLGVYLVIDRPSYGFSVTEVEQIVAGLVAWLTTGNVDKLYGKES
jgi:hypothetical protein